MGRLLTAKQLVEEFNLPSVRTVRTLRDQGLPTVKLGAARLTDYDDMVAFIERKKEVISPTGCAPIAVRAPKAAIRKPTGNQDQARRERLLAIFQASSRKPPR